MKLINKLVLGAIAPLMLSSSLYGDNNLNDTLLLPYNTPDHLNTFLRNANDYTKERIISRKIINTGMVFEGYDIAKFIVEMKDGYVFPDIYLPFKDGRYVGNKELVDEVTPTLMGYVNIKLFQSNVYKTANRYLENKDNKVIYVKIGNPDTKNKYVVLADPRCSHCINFLNSSIRKGTMNLYDIDMVMFPVLGEKSIAMSFNLGQEIKKLGKDIDREKSLAIITKYFNYNADPKLSVISDEDKAEYEKYKDKVINQTIQWRYFGADDTPTFYAIDNEAYKTIILKN